MDKKLKIIIAIFSHPLAKLLFSSGSIRKTYDRISGILYCGQNKDCKREICFLRGVVSLNIYQGAACWSMITTA